MFERVAQIPCRREVGVLMRTLILLAAIAASFSAGIANAQLTQEQTTAIIQEGFRKAMEASRPLNDCKWSDKPHVAVFKLIHRDLVAQTETYQCTDGSTLTIK